MRGVGEGVAGSQPMSTAVHNARGAQINFGDLTPYLTYDAYAAPVAQSAQSISTGLITAEAGNAPAGYSCPAHSS